MRAHGMHGSILCCSTWVIQQHLGTPGAAAGAADVCGASGGEAHGSSSLATLLESSALLCLILPQSLVVFYRLSAVNAGLEGNKHTDKMEVMHAEAVQLTAAVAFKLWSAGRPRALIAGC